MFQADGSASAGSATDQAGFSAFRVQQSQVCRALNLALWDHYTTTDNLGVFGNVAAAAFEVVASPVDVIFQGRALNMFVAPASLVRGVCTVIP